ncbi:hypothetical protein PQ465_02600 [Sphingobacterium oryzagri]|uniref:DUF4843 domain-containing protein n=1 Tax=Sphingobacterium oryzagri TaxID=3025669 RepID=A0ABY7WKX4_9SPHI|nr:hypothetical protein [Sphingobacterium sp. KACC 22765]WDF69282.1 hypothetical protein PQ465_02600 [Sphingobacterium sp. KACC 22765]
MKKYIIIMLTLTASFFSSCEKNYTELYSDNRPDVPVTFEGATTHGFNPFIEVPLAQGNFSLTLTIPQESGRQIREITRALGGATSINAGGVRAATYITSPIAGNGNRVVFNTSVTAFRASSAANNTLIQNFINNAALTRLEIAFMFLVTLDNGQEIIPVQARVFLVK